MFERSVDNGASLATLPSQQASEIDGWIDAWPGVRSEVVAMVEEYVRRNPSFEQHMVDWLLEELDGSMRILRHRVNWLRDNLNVDRARA
jgi:hypothetical protein